MASRERARLVLAAWTIGDRKPSAEFRSEPDGWSDVNRLTAEEQERRELLDGIQSRLNTAGASNGPVVTVSLRLLRHLAV
jgi:hypothetical protein